MFTIQVKVQNVEKNSNKDFLLFINRGNEEGYQAFTRAEADVLLPFLERYPAIFEKPFIRNWDENTPLIDANDMMGDYDFSMQEVFDKFSSEDQDFLQNFGSIGGFSQKYTADNI